MIELVIVIVIAGILAAVMIPRLERDTLREAANQVVRHIQYTQHLAMVNDVYDATNPNWELAYWHISFRVDPTKCYIVASDANTNGGVPAQSEAALDPLTQQFLYSDTTCTENSQNNNDLFLNTKYGVSTVTVADGCSTTNQLIAFDNLGRPLKSKDVSNPVTVGNPCTITLSTATGTAVITIEPETGYTRITSITN